MPPKFSIALRWLRADRQIVRGGYQLPPNVRLVEFSDGNMQSGRRYDLPEALGDRPFNQVVSIKKFPDDEHGLLSQEFQEALISRSLTDYKNL